MESRRRVPTHKRTNEKGQEAEDAAVLFLRERGLEILERNYRCVIGELDIVARDGADLVFVEVRSRSDDDHGDASTAVGVAKQKQVARVAEYYVNDTRTFFHCARFDVIASTAGDLEWFIDAFRPGLE